MKENAISLKPLEKCLKITVLNHKSKIQEPAKIKYSANKVAL